MDLRANTAVDVLIGPFVDKTDGNTTEDGLTLTQAEIKLSKNGQGLTQKNEATSAAFDDDGYYNCMLDVTDTDTEGSLVLIVHQSANALPVRHEFNVLSEAAWDSLYAAKDSGFMDVNVKAWTDTATSAGVGGDGVPASIAQADRNAYLIESQNGGAHTYQGNHFYVDPVNGDTHASGNRGGRTDPYQTIQDCHDNAVTDSNHDVIFLVAGHASTATTHTIAGTTTLSKRYLTIRGPGRDFIITRTGAGDTLAVTGDGISLSGFQLGTAATGSGHGIKITDADFVKVEHVWILDTQGDGVHILRGSNCVISLSTFAGTGVGGTGQGVHIVGTAGASTNNRIVENVFSDTAGDSILIEQGTTNQTLILKNIIHDSSGWAINIGASSTDAIVHGNVLGNNSSGNINDGGTTTIQHHNRDWLSATVEGRTLGVESDGDLTKVNAIAANAIGASQLAADAVTKLRSYLSGTADSGSTTTLTDAALSQADDDWWNGMGLLITSGTLAGQMRPITDFEESTDAITVFPAFTQVVATHTYEIIPVANPSVNSIADQVWDELFTNHVSPGSFGKLVADIDADGVAIKAVTDLLPNSGALTAIGTDTARLTAVRAAILTDWINGGRLDAILDLVATAANLATAQADLDTITGTAGVELATGQTAAWASALEAAASTITEGTAKAGTLSTTQMSTTLTNVDDAHNGGVLIFKADTVTAALRRQRTDITDFANTNGVLTFTAVTVQPAATETFVIV